MLQRQAAHIGVSALHVVAALRPLHESAAGVGSSGRLRSGCHTVGILGNYNLIQVYGTHGGIRTLVGEDHLVLVGLAIGAVGIINTDSIDIVVDVDDVRALGQGLGAVDSCAVEGHLVQKELLTLVGGLFIRGVQAGHRRTDLGVGYLVGIPAGLAAVPGHIVSDHLIGGVSLSLGGSGEDHIAGGHVEVAGSHFCRHINVSGSPRSGVGRLVADLDGSVCRILFLFTVLHVVHHIGDSELALGPLVLGHIGDVAGNGFRPLRIPTLEGIGVVIIGGLYRLFDVRSSLALGQVGELQLCCTRSSTAVQIILHSIRLNGNLLEAPGAGDGHTTLDHGAVVRICPPAEGVLAVHVAIGVVGVEHGVLRRIHCIGLAFDVVTVVRRQVRGGHYAGSIIQCLILGEAAPAIFHLIGAHRSDRAAIFTGTGRIIQGQGAGLVIHRIIGEAGLAALRHAVGGVIA